MRLHTPPMENTRSGATEASIASSDGRDDGAGGVEGAVDGAGRAGGGRRVGLLHATSARPSDRSAVAGFMGAAEGTSTRRAAV